MPKTHRFQSPFEHWESGLLTEIVAFSAYLIVLAVAIGAVILIERAL